MIAEKPSCSIQDDDIVFVIVSDCGGGDDYNPYTSLEAALARIEAVDGPDATGLEVWRMTFRQYESDDDYDPLYNPNTDCVWER